MRRNYRIDSVEVLSRGEQVAYVITPVGGFVVGAIPELGEDALEVGILARANSYDEAVSWYRKVYGLEG